MTMSATINAALRKTPASDGTWKGGTDAQNSHLLRVAQTPYGVCLPLAEDGPTPDGTSEIRGAGLPSGRHVEAHLVADPFQDALLHRAFCRPANVVIVDMDGSVPSSIRTKAWIMTCPPKMIFTSFCVAERRPAASMAGGSSFGAVARNKST